MTALIFFLVFMIFGSYFIGTIRGEEKAKHDIQK